MRTILTLIIILVFIGNNATAQNFPTRVQSSSKESRTEIITELTKLPEVSVTYLSKSMIQRLPKDKSGSPLAILIRDEGVESIRLFQLGSVKASTEGKKLMNTYLSDNSGFNNAELLMFQNNSSKEVIIYGIPIVNDISYYRRVLFYSKTDGKNAILIIIEGKIRESAISELIESFSN